MLKAKTALITGSTSGIGLAIAEALAREGANVMLNGLSDENEIEKTRAGPRTANRRRRCASMEQT
jgi:3-hydroxybutyrate dehydrogenase